MPLFTSNSEPMNKKTIITMTVLLLLSIPVTLLCWCFLVPAQYDGTFMGELKYKQDLLENTPGKRLILVGGSSVAFGVDSAALEAELPEYHVVNFGMYAALGTTVMLDLSENLLRQGDLVVLIPEQQNQTLSAYFDPDVMWQGVDGAYELLTCLSRDQLGMMLGALPTFAGEKFAWFLRGQMPQPEGVYSRDSFNEYGDVESSLCARNVMAGGWDSNTPIRFDADVLEEDFVERVNAYANAAEARGARVYYGFCPMNALAITGESTVEDYYNLLLEKLEIPLLGDPRNSVLDAGWFYDTNFHLNSSGRQLYTRLLARSLKAELGDSSTTEIAIPPMPDLEKPALWQGDDTDAACFRYERQGEAWTVTGLTEEGLLRQSLTVPSTWEGLPVTAIASGAFSKAAALETVTVQQNIRRIGDGAFAGCEALTAIRMEQGSPSSCVVGQGLLEGTDALIFVPADRLSAYRTDYFWSVYGTKIQPQT